MPEDADYIHMELYQDREARTLTKAYEDGFDFFMKYEYHPTYLRLDNEKSVIFETMCARRNVKLQPVPDPTLIFLPTNGTASRIKLKLPSIS